MNRRQKIILCLGAIAFVVAGLYPPWIVKVRGQTGKDLGYHLLSKPPLIPSSSIKPGAIDFQRLGIEWAIIAVITGALCISASHGRNERKSQMSNTCKEN